MSETGRRLRVVLLFGGRSAEHEVSCVSAREIAAALDPQRYEVTPIGITRDGKWLLPNISARELSKGSRQVSDAAFEPVGEPVMLIQDPARGEIVPLDPAAGGGVGRPDVVLAMLHGPQGEDGTVQGMLELADIPYVGSGVLGSALGMDKEKMKVMFRASGLPVGEFAVIREYEWEADPKACVKRAAELGLPCFTKPANLGSSVGISRCSDLGELESGIAEAFRHDRKVIVEEALVSREIECGVLGNDFPEASVCGEVIAGRDFYDYTAKYLDDSSSTVIPADIPDEVGELIRRYSIEAFRAIDAEGMARVDFFYDAGGRGVVVNEINTIPGFTTISMFPKLWEASGVPYDKLIDRLIELGLERHSRKRRAEDLSPPAAGLDIPRGELQGR